MSPVYNLDLICSYFSWVEFGFAAALHKYFTYNNYEEQSFFFRFAFLNFKRIVPLLNPATHQDYYQALAHFQPILNSIIT